MEEQLAACLADKQTTYILEVIFGLPVTLLLVYKAGFRRKWFWVMCAGLYAPLLIPYETVDRIYESGKIPAIAQTIILLLVGTTIYLLFPWPVNKENRQLKKKIDELQKQVNLLTGLDEGEIDFIKKAKN